MPKIRTRVNRVGPQDGFTTFYRENFNIPPRLPGIHLLPSPENQLKTLTIKTGPNAGHSSHITVLVTF